MKALSCLTGLALLLTLAGCDNPRPSDRDAGPRPDGAPPMDGGGGGPALASLADLYTATYCSFLERCYPSTVDAIGGDCASWLEASIEDGALPRWEAAVARGTATYHPERVAACLDTIEGLACTETPSADACQAIFEGSVAAGGECFIDDECAGDSFCDLDGGMCPGTCAPRVGEGGACTSGLECDPPTSCSEGTCRLPLAEGEACVAGSAPYCGPGLICVDADGSGATSCVVESSLHTLAVGEVCNGGSAFCLEGLSCVYVRSDPGPVFECVEELASGEACTLSTSFPDACPEAEHCDLPPSSFEGGTCRPLPAVGEPCSAFGRCARGAYCEGTPGGDGVCTAIERIGGSCLSDRGCAGNYCDPSGTCAVRDCLY